MRPPRLMTRFSALPSTAWRLQLNEPAHGEQRSAQQVSTADESRITQESVTGELDHSLTVQHELVVQDAELQEKTRRRTHSSVSVTAAAASRTARSCAAARVSHLVVHVRSRVVVAHGDALQHPQQSHRTRYIVRHSRTCQHRWQRGSSGSAHRVDELLDVRAASFRLVVVRDHAHPHAARMRRKHRVCDLSPTGTSVSVSQAPSPSCLRTHSHNPAPRRT